MSKYLRGFGGLLCVLTPAILSACGDSKPDLAAQQVLAAQGTCDNPVSFDQPSAGAQEVPSAAIVDGKDGRYVATHVDYFFHLDHLGREATHRMQSTVTRTTPDANPQYSMDLTCKKGDPNLHIDASLLIPDSINRKDGTVVLRTEKFSDGEVSITGHASETEKNHTLEEFLYEVGADESSPQQSKIYMISSTSFDIVFRLKVGVFESTVFGQIHYEFAPASSPASSKSL
jgi:hypothetical protein